MIRILLVEDSFDYARLVVLLLEEALGAHVATRHVQTLGAACDALDEEAFDVVLLDLSLPDAHGPSAVDELRAAHPAAVVVVLSGRDEPGLAEDLARRGAGYVRKGDEHVHLGPALIRAMDAAR
jgi:DNA-binding response OmpR family regulator